MNHGLRYPVMIFIIIFMGTITTPGSAWNEETHMKINEYAISEGLKNLKFVSFDGSANGDDSEKHVVNENENPKKIQITSNAEHSINDWIIAGGRLADRPKNSAFLDHFYNPQSDEGLFGPLLSIFLGGQPTPDWAVSERNKYSWKNGVENLKLALNSPGDNKSVYYGIAWRSLGESMHLISDMTLPAHVWNDMHPIKDPLEESTNPEIVKNIMTNDAKKPFKSSIKFIPDDLKSNLKSVADWTHANFYSDDKTPDVKNIEQLVASGYVQTEGDYYLRSIDGIPSKIGKQVQLKAAESSSHERDLLWNKPNQAVITVNDQSILDDQRSKLIPTAVNVSSMLLTQFLPTFELKQDPVNGSNGFITVSGTLTQKTTGALKEQVIVANGAMIKDGDKIIVVPSSAYVAIPGKTTISYNINTPSTKDIELFFNLGGYVIHPVNVQVEQKEILIKNGPGIVGYWKWSDVLLPAPCNNILYFDGEGKIWMVSVSEGELNINTKADPIGHWESKSDGKYDIAVIDIIGFTYTLKGEKFYDGDTLKGRRLRPDDVKKCL